MFVLTSCLIIYAQHNFNSFCCQSGINPMMQTPQAHRGPTGAPGKRGPTGATGLKGSKGDIVNASANKQKH